MESNNLSEILNALAKGKNRPTTARLREIFDEIEAALQAGVRRKDVHQALTTSGFSITFESFELAIYRIRKERKKQNIHPARPAQGTPVKPTGTNPLRTLSGNPKEGEFNPTQIVNFELDNSERK